MYLYSFDMYLRREEKIVTSNLKESYLSYFALSLFEYTLGMTILFLNILLFSHSRALIDYHFLLRVHSNNNSRICNELWPAGVTLLGYLLFLFFIITFTCINN